jgi:hypothetical protein
MESYNFTCNFQRAACPLRFLEKLVYYFLASGPLIFNFSGFESAGGLGLSASFFRARGKALLKKVHAG